MYPFGMLIKPKLNNGIVARITVDGKEIQFEIIYSKRKTLAIEVRPPSTIIVRAPQRTNRQNIDDLVRSKIKWITKSLETVSMVEQREKILYSEGSEVTVLGFPRRISIVQIVGKLPRNARFQLGPKSLTISYDRAKLETNEHVFLKKKLVKFFKNKSLEYLKEKTYKYAELIGKGPSEVTVRYFKSRWASTYSTDKIKYNYRLVMAPVPVINYVVVHELVHLVHFNHSPKFWKLVETYIPNRKEIEEELRRKSDVYKL